MLPSCTRPVLGNGGILLNVCCVVNRAGNVIAMKTATPYPLLVIAVVDDNPADVSFIARVLQAHQVPFVLQGLESRQRALHFLTSSAGRTSGVLISCSLTLPFLAWTPESCCNGSKPCRCVGGYALS
jgi:hypothetical protein